MNKFTLQATQIMGFDKIEQDIDIDIFVGTQRMEDKLLDKVVGGYCSCFHDGKKSSSYDVDIELARLSNVESMLVNLCHEIIHAKQYIFGELGMMFAIDDDSLNITNAWKGKKWVAAKNDDPYYDAPWEKEAYDRENELYEQTLVALAKKK
jgi:hypothetical protein